MNPFRIELRDEVAYAALQIAKDIGDRIEYQDRANARPVCLWAIPESEDFDLGENAGLQEQRTRRKFAIPRQPGECGEAAFPPEPEPSHHAMIYCDNWDWSVDEWKRDSVGAVFTCDCTRNVARRTAVR